MHIGKKTPHIKLFPSNLNLDLNSVDAKEMEVQSAFWSYEHKQFSKGKFQGRIIAAHTSQLQLSLANRSTGIIIRGSIPSGTTILTLPVSMTHSFYYRGQALAEHEIIALHSNEEIELQTSLPSSLITVAVCQDLLEHQCLEVTGHSFNELRYQERLFINPVDYDRCIGNLVQLLQEMRCTHFTPCDWEERMIEKAILEIILFAVLAPEKRQKLPGRLYVAKKAERFIRRNLKQSISIKDLCFAIGTSERTLHQGFKERFGISPKVYIRRMRLNGIHQDLLLNKNKTTISDIAMEWGLFHLGRFSAQYRQMFDELPQKTHKRKVSPLLAPRPKTTY